MFMHCLLTNINMRLSGNIAVISASQQEVSPWKHAFFLFQWKFYVFVMCS